MLQQAVSALYFLIPNYDVITPFHYFESTVNLCIAVMCVNDNNASIEFDAAGVRYGDGFQCQHFSWPSADTRPQQTMRSW